jgi:hypothetical protein
MVRAASVLPDARTWSALEGKGNRAAITAREISDLEDVGPRPLTAPAPDTHLAGASRSAERDDRITSGRQKDLAAESYE